jgi:hypothetical protein
MQETGLQGQSKVLELPQRKPDTWRISGNQIIKEGMQEVA